VSRDEDLDAGPVVLEQPLPTRGIKVNLRWREDFLEAYEEYGGLYKAAKLAGIDSTTVYAEMERNAEFKRLTEEARQRFADSQEHALRVIGDKGNPVGPIVLLKKHRPAEFIEKTVSMSLSASVELEAADGKALLQAMLRAATPATVQALAPGPSETP
jgi:hypothetical protein